MRAYLVMLGLAIGALGVGSPMSAGASNTGQTQWLSSRAHAARIARIESGMPPVVIAHEDPVALTLERWMALYRIPGLSVAVFDANRIIWARAYGVKQAGRSEPVTLTTLFQAGSISKPVTAMAVLHYVQSGRWSLDANINDALTSWKLPDNALTRDQHVTLRRLLSHSAGTTVHGFPGYASGDTLPTLVQVLDGVPPANTAPVRVDIVPGTKTRYSGGGTSIVQLMMVDGLRKPFPQIMAETVLSPLGLTNSSYEQPLPARLAAMTASGTRASGATVEGRWHVYPEMAAAGLWTTASDLARVAIEVSKAKAGRSNRVLSPAMTKQMLTRQSDGFGLGFALEGTADRFGHNGADEGFQAYLTAFADSGRGLVIMANSDNGSRIFERLAASIGREYGWTALVARTPPLVEQLGLLARVKGVDHALAWYQTMRRETPASEPTPWLLNRIGYELLGEARAADAVKVFEANVALYPGDANAYDSLAEGQLANGQRDVAIANYRKSLQLDPNNANAVKMLATLGVRWIRDTTPPR